MQEGQLPDAPVWSNLKTFDGRDWYEKIHILTGGYPCQPFSVAGKQNSEADERHLWPEVLRIIKETQAPVLFFENVANHLNLGFIEVRKSLREMGYRVKTGVFSAEEVGANHRRQRLFILAYKSTDWKETLIQKLWNSDVGNTYSARLEGRNESIIDSPHEFYAWPPSPEERHLWNIVLDRAPELAPATEPDFRRMVNGFSDPMEPSRHRTERIKALGNAVVPMVAAYAFHTLLTN